MEKRYPIKKNEREFFRAYVEILKPFLKHIRDREADVFAELLYQNYKRREIRNKNDRFKLILEKDSRRNMEEYLGVSHAIFRNCLSGLRSKELLLDDNTIVDEYLIIPEQNSLRLIFDFIIKND